MLIFYSEPRLILPSFFNSHLAVSLSFHVDREKGVFEAKMGGGPAAKQTSELVLSSRTIREFDARFTAPQFGYPSVDAYYADACMTERLSDVRTPLLGIAAEDDPFQPADGIPTKFDREAPVAMVVTKRGGHIAHLEGVVPYWSGPPFYVKLARDFLTAIFSDVTHCAEKEQ
jgi:predicted alpha/beta-fold hydrolase